MSATSVLVALACAVFLLGGWLSGRGDLRGMALMLLAAAALALLSWPPAGPPAVAP